MLFLQFKGIRCILEERPRTASGGKHTDRNENPPDVASINSTVYSSNYTKNMYFFILGWTFPFKASKSEKVELEIDSSNFISLTFPPRQKDRCVFTLKLTLFSLQALDYSDDEKEQVAKRKGKNSKKKRDNNNTGIHTHIHTQEIYSVCLETCLDGLEVLL